MSQCEILRKDWPVKTNVAVRTVFAVALACVGGMNAANAATITVNTKLDSASGLWGSPIQTQQTDAILNVDYDSGYSTQTIDGQVYAGALSFTNSVWSANYPNGPTNFRTYCIEFSQDVNVGQTVLYTLDNLGNAPKPLGGDNPGSPGMGGGDGLGLAGRARDTLIKQLWSRYIDGTGVSGAELGLIVDDRLKSAGFQLALWKIIYETVPGSFLDVSAGAGNIKILGSDADTLAAIGFAESYLTNLAAGTNWTQAFGLYALTSDTAQDQLIQLVDVNLTSVVPLPASVWSGGALLVGLGLMRRRRQ